MSKTRPLGAGTVNLSVNLPSKAYEDLKALARANDEMKIGEYVRCVLYEALKTRPQYAVTTERIGNFSSAQVVAAKVANATRPAAIKMARLRPRSDPPTDDISSQAPGEHQRGGQKHDQ